MDFVLWERLSFISPSHCQNLQHYPFMSLKPQLLHLSHNSDHRLAEWQGSLQVVWSNLLLKQGHLSGCPEPCPDSFWVSLRMEISPPLWTTCASTPVTLTVRKYFPTFPLHFSLCLLPWSRAATPCCGSIYPLILYMPPAPPASPLSSLKCSTSCAWALVRS